MVSQIMHNSKSLILVVHYTKYISGILNVVKKDSGLPHCGKAEI